MKKLILCTLLILAANSYSNEVIYEDFSFKEPVIQTGLKQAKQNVKTTFVYNENDMYRIYARAGFITTINLNPDEEVTYLAGGDTARWVIDVGMAGSSQGQHPILAIKPFFPGIKTNLIVSTNKRTYQFFLHSANEWYNPTVSFVYPQDQLMAKIKEQKLKEESTPINLDSLNYKYEWKKTKDRWCPQQVFDDGEKTFILMPEKVEQGELPILLIRDEQTGEGAIVRHRYNPNNRFFIVDRLFEQAILKLGKKEIIINREGSFIKSKNDHYPVTR